MMRKPPALGAPRCLTSACSVACRPVTEVADPALGYPAGTTITICICDSPGGGPPPFSCIGLIVHFNPPDFPPLSFFECYNFNCENECDELEYVDENGVTWLFCWC